MSSQPSVDLLEQAITDLDVALCLIARIEDQDIARGVVAQHVCATLAACYEAWQRMGDALGLSQSRQQAEASLQATLAALQQAPSDDPYVDQACRALASVFAVLRQLAPGFSSGGDLPRSSGAASIALASQQAPSMIHGRQRLLEPATLIAIVPTEDVEPAKVKAAAPARATSAADVDALIEAASASASGASAESASAPGDNAAPEPKNAVVPVEETPSRMPEHVLNERAQSCWQDMAAMCGMRRVADDDTWGDVARTEQRLLARLDAIVACGVDRLASLVAQLAARPIADPELTWALMLTYGSLAHRDASDQCLRLAATAPLDDSDMLIAITDALALAPHPRIAERLPRWLSNDDPHLRLIATGALGRRGRLSNTEIFAALHDIEPRVVIAGLNALTQRAPSHADAIDAATLKRLNACLRDEDEAVVEAALQAALIHAPTLTSQRATELVQASTPSFANAIMYLALCADGRVFALFEMAAREQPCALVFEAMGWYGATQAFTPLLDAMRSDEEDIVRAAAHALYRLTNAPLSSDMIELPKPLVDHTLTPFATPQLDEPCLDAEPWRRFISAYASKVRTQARYRWGRPYTLFDNLWELDAADSCGRQRRWAHFELAARSGCSAQLDRDDFVHTQRGALASWRTMIEARPLIAGAWPPHPTW